ncbi:MAG: phospholipase D-like domain-containing protein [Hormoscilla sp.]
MNNWLRVAIEYVPVIGGLFFIFHNQTIPAFVAFALYVPVNQVMRYLEVKGLKNSKNSSGPSGIEQHNTHIFKIGSEIDSISQISNQLNSKVKQYNRAFVRIGRQISSLEQIVNQHASDIESLQQFLEELSASSVDQPTQLWLKTVLQKTRPEYIPLSDRHESHRVLKQSLGEVRRQMILVCPWLNWYVFNKYRIYQELQRLLEQGVKIDLIYGYQEDIVKLQNSGDRVNRWTLLELVGKDAWKYDAIRELTNLEQQFGQQLQLKLVGTHEKFLVQDERIAMIGSHNFLTSGPSDKREFGIQTTDRNLIQFLLDRAQSVQNLEVADESPGPPFNSTKVWPQNTLSNSRESPR